MDTSEVHITKLAVGRTVDLGQYESIRFDITAEVRPGQAWQDVMDGLKAIVVEEERVIREEYGRPPRKPVTVAPSGPAKKPPVPPKAEAPPVVKPAEPKKPTGPVKLDPVEFKNDPLIKAAVADFARRLQQGAPRGTKAT